MNSSMFLSPFPFSSAVLHILLLSFFCLTTMAIGSNVTDLEALIEFKAKITDDPLGVMASWNDTSHFCQWPGVACSSRHSQRVISLDLHSLKLSGSIPPHIGNLSFLNQLLLQNNSFTDEIPPQIGRLRRLQYLALFNNSFIGRIPSNISMCSNLIRASFAYNDLQGEIPMEFGSLPRLDFLSADNNNLTGSIPSSFGNLTSLTALSLTFNYFSGAIPDTLGQLKNLQAFLLYGNILSSTIPPSILNMSSITMLDVGNNELQGRLPMDLGSTLPNLQIFSVLGNQFSGQIPASIRNVSSLIELQFEGNQFTGSVPSLEKLQSLRIFVLGSNNLGSGGVEDDLNFLYSLTNVSTLEEFTMNNNRFGGVLPEYIGNLSWKLATLVLDTNFISGSIPTGVENLVNLRGLHVGNNQLSGTIPASIGKLQNLRRMVFQQNKFSGQIPSSLGNLTRLLDLYLSSNILEGSIPSSLGNCKNLIRLDVSNNNLSGVIPPEILGLSSLSIYLSLAHNHLTGPLPTEVRSLKNLGILDVSDNMLSSEIPASISSCTSLQSLLMHGNLFRGTIPSTLRSLKGLQVLDLSRNNLSGTIPEFLADFTSLYSLNLSYNNFEGRVPTKGGIFTNASGMSVTDNNNLCGGIPELHLPICRIKEFEKSGVTSKQKLIIGVVSGLVGVTFVLFILLILWLKRKKKKPAASELEESFFRVSHQDLLKATNGFSSENLIGKGSFGSVYKGILHQDGTIVAVKVLNLSSKGASKSFLAECDALKNVRHRNLVKVLTACSTIDNHGNDFKALVYEFMVNGSLEDWLHPSIGINKANEVPRNLGFLQRLNIAIDVACALKYLHHDCGTPIIHCDLKPSNVLLNDDMVGHVGDFGLAKFLLKETHNSTTNQSSSIVLRGTIGYAPPEYGIGNEVSTYGDVYSFGILLLEIFTGKKPTDNKFKEGLNLWNYVTVALSKKVTEIVDPILIEELAESESYSNSIHNQGVSSPNDRVFECLVSIFKIGVSCSTEFPRERNNMSKVVVELCSIRDKFLQT